MEPFEIEITGINYELLPLTNESYEVYEAGKLLGTVKPNVTDLGVRWVSDDGITADFADQIGELIEEHDM